MSSLGILRIVNALLEYRTVRKAAKHVLCSETFIYDNIQGEWIYFFVLEDRVKIGYTSNLVERIKSFRLHTGGAGKFDALIKGSKADEKRIQHNLKEYHIMGEWFHLADEEIVAYIKELQDGRYD